jgi:protein-S-isoprenylcysteine O-methyltransferase Ste14
MLYFSIHSLFASLRFKQFILLSYPGIMPWYRLIFNILAMLLLIPPVFLMLMYPGELVWQWSGNWRYLANTLALLAIAGFIFSLRSYDSSEFIGTRQLKEDRKDFKERESFHLSVFHRYVRHPWYAFALVLIWTRDMYISYLISAILMSLYFIIGSYLEEKKLIVFHGDQYRLYRKYVAALIPLPWRILSAQKAAEIVALNIPEDSENVGRSKNDQ